MSPRYAIAVCAALAGLAVASFAWPAAEYPYQRIPATLPGAPLDDSTIIYLQRGPCFGDCPEYSVTVYGSGRIEFEGRRFVCAPGHHTAQASPDEVRQLVGRMLEFGYLDLSWRSGTIPTMATIVTSSLSHGGRTNRIEHSTGDSRAPPGLRRLEDDIDTLAGSWRWLPEKEDNRRVCRRKDGETELFEIYIPGS